MIVEIEEPVTLTLKIGHYEAVTVYFNDNHQKTVFMLGMQELQQEVMHLRQTLYGTNN